VLENNLTLNLSRHHHLSLITFYLQEIAKPEPKQISSTVIFCNTFSLTFWFTIIFMSHLHKNKK